jgi:hypothetical protein
MDVQVTRGGERHPVMVKLAAPVYESAEAAARDRGMTVSQWVGVAVVEALEAPALARIGGGK